MQVLLVVNHLSIQKVKFLVKLSSIKHKTTFEHFMDEKKFNEAFHFVYVYGELEEYLDPCTNIHIRPPDYTLVEELSQGSYEHVFRKI